MTSPELERVAQILQLPYEERLARVTDLLVRTWAQALLQSNRYLTGDPAADLSCPYLPTARQAADREYYRTHQT